MSCWTVLGITPTRNIKKIEESYLNLMSLIGSDENNPQYKDLKSAYNKAISLATASINDLDASLFKGSRFEILSAIINSSLDSSEIYSVEKFIEKVTEIYNDPTLRFNKEVWIDLLTLPILRNCDLSSSLEKELIYFLYNHKYLPHYVYTLLNSHFNWTEKINELNSNYNNDVIKALIASIQNPSILTYDYLLNIQSEKLDQYLILRENAFLFLQESNLNKAKKYLLEAYSIYSQDLDLLKLLGKYYLSKNDNIMALNYFKEAIKIDNNDMYTLANLGHLLAISSQYSKAILYLEKYNKKLKTTIDIDSLTDLAYCYYHSYELQKAADLLTLLLKLTPYNKSIKSTLDNINIKSIKENIENSLVLSIYKKYIDKYSKPCINKLNEIYDNFKLRISEESWQDLFNLPIASEKNLFYLLEEIIIEFITTNKIIPNNIFIILNNHFLWTERETELYSLYPWLNINLLFDKLSIRDNLSYSHIKDINPAYFEEYVKNRLMAYKSMSINSSKTEIYLDKALSLYNKDYELFKIYGDYYSNNNLYRKAIESFKTALTIKKDDHYSSCSLAVLLTKTENYKEALSYLEQSVNTPAGSMLLSNSDFLTKYAICYYYTNDLLNAKKYFTLLCSLGKKLHFIDIYLKNINDRLSGKRREVISIDIINNPNYTTTNFFKSTIDRLTSIKTIFSARLSTLTK